MNTNELETFYPKNKAEWRQWLMKNHLSKQSVWLVCYKKESGKPSINWSDAVDEALCFGWIDSTRKSMDHEKFIQFFSKRRPNGTWSKINKEKIKRLISDGLMMQAGLDCIEAAKKNGSWHILDQVDELIVPDDLAKAFKRHQGSAAFFERLSTSVKKTILYWIVSAKRPETRQKRIQEVAERAGQKQKPNQF